MASQHFLPCPHCQSKIPVSTTQAGQTIECKLCNQPFEAPKFQDLRAYPLASEPPRTAPIRDHFLSRAFYTGGLMLILLGLGGGTALFFYSGRLINLFDFDQSMQMIQDKSKELSPVEVYWQWFYIENQGELKEWMEHPVVGLQTQGRILRTVSYVIFGLAGLGLILMICSPFVKSRRRKSVRK